MTTQKVVRLQITLTVEDLETGHHTEQVLMDAKNPDGFGKNLNWSLNRQLDPIYSSDEPSSRAQGYKQNGPVEYTLEYKDWQGDGRVMGVTDP